MNEQDRELARFQISRLGGLRRYPRAPEPLSALLDAALAFATLPELRRFIDDWLRNHQECPVPAALYSEVRAHFKPENAGTCRCTACYDTGQASAPFLVTWDGGKKTRQRLTREQEAALWRDHGAEMALGKQMMYEALVPCDCGHKSQAAGPQ